MTSGHIRSFLIYEQYILFLTHSIAAPSSSSSSFRAHPHCAHFSVHPDCYVLLTPFVSYCSPGLLSPPHPHTFSIRSSTQLPPLFQTVTSPHPFRYLLSIHIDITSFSVLFTFPRPPPLVHIITYSLPFRYLLFLSIITSSSSILLSSSHFTSLIPAR